MRNCLMDWQRIGLGFLVCVGLMSRECQAQERPRAEAAKAATGAQAPAPRNEAAKPSPPPQNPASEDAPPVVTSHEIQLRDGRTLKYKASVGTLPIRNAANEIEARIFYMAYTAEGVADKARRPLMFSFNGGPGSASLWLHLGALGPQRVVLPDDASFPRPPFKLVENPDTWLADADLVFIDPVGTGYSRAAKPDVARKFFSLRGDIESIREFIRLYLAREDRWGSPLYLVGESYGTTRAAGLSEELLDHGIAPSGIVLVSTILNFQTTRFAQGNDLPYILYLPSYAATAWYHKKLAAELQSDLHRTYEEVHAFALGDYTLALAQGDRLPTEKRQEIVRRMARYTGLSPEFIDRSDLRVELGRFCKELLRDQRRTVGRLDSRYKGIDADAASSSFETDPSMAAIRAPYTATFHQLIRGPLGYRTDLPYYVLGEGVGAWDYGSSGGPGGGGQGYADTSAALRDAMAKNPHLRLFVASGYYDLATPVAATGYTLEHMDLDPSMRPRISTKNYDSGHMMYIHEPSMRQLAQDVFTFLKADAAP